MHVVNEHMREIRFVYPSKTTAISVTGTSCQLKCAHCGGHYLKSMTPLASVVNGERQASACSWLISGGCNTEGGIFFTEQLAVLRELKGDRKFNVHTGLIDNRQIAEVATIADRVSFDFIGDDDTIREVLGSSRTVEDYVACYRNLRGQMSVAPHICIGLHGGRLRGEWRVLELLRELGADSLTLLVFIPTKGTRYADCRPPSLEEIAAFFDTARQAFSAIPIHLGCMRPGGRYRNDLDILAVKAGLDSIVNPSSGAIALAAELGIFTTVGEECCCL
ncbi:MAG: Elongator protein 3/MiaB/NifB [Firmicutes bacterium]|nr:Elongator protein 3/MiaB/NifB [Bacillota bacterium]